MRQSSTLTLTLLLSLFACLFAACSGQPALIDAGTVGNPYEEIQLSDAEAKDLGSVRITYRQYANAGIVGNHAQARSNDTTEIFVNESHASYDHASNEKLRRNEYFVSDGVMLQILNAFRDQGYFTPAMSGVKRVPKGVSLETYARGYSGIFKWIGVEYHDETYLITRNDAQEITSRELEMAQVFNRCELVVLRASNNKRLKASLREVSRADLEREHKEQNDKRR